MEFVVIAQYRARAGEEGRVGEAHFTTWLSGQVLPSLDERTRLDLVPIEDFSPVVADDEALGFTTPLT